MCHEPTATNDTPEGNVLPFMRTVDRAGAPPPRPSRPSFVETVYDLAKPAPWSA